MRNFLNVIDSLACLVTDELQRVVAMRQASWISGVPEKYFLSMTCAKAACHFKVFPFNVMHDRRSRPVEQVRYHKAHAFSRTSRCKTKHMFKPASDDKFLTDFP